MQNIMDKLHLCRQTSFYTNNKSFFYFYFVTGFCFTIEILYLPYISNMQTIDLQDFQYSITFILWFNANYVWICEIIKFYYTFICFFFFFWNTSTISIIGIYWILLYQTKWMLCVAVKGTLTYEVYFLFCISVR